MGTSARRERAHLTRVMRAEGKTWARIAETIRERYGVNARIAFRWAHDWTQNQAADAWTERWPDDPKSNQNISTWERWPESGHEPSLRNLTRLARLYECDLSDLVADLGRYSHFDSANTGPAIEAVAQLAQAVGVEDAFASDSQDDTNRREFTRSAVLAALGLTDLREVLTGGGADDRVTVIGSRHLRIVETAVERIEAHDAAVGGDDLRAGVATLRSQVEDWLNGPAFSVHRVSEELESLLGELTAWAGWLAFDADDKTAASRWLQEAMVQARVTEDPQLEVRALSYMCLLTHDDRPRQSLQCAEAALRRATGWATPRLLTLLHLRSARAFASLGEPKSFSREIAKAKGFLDSGEHEDDPLYVRFVTPMEVAGITGLSLLAMNKPDRAADSFRSIVEMSDPSYRRNAGYYSVRLAEAVARQHDISQASEIAMSALDQVSGLESSRTSRHLRTLRAMIEPHRATVQTARDFANAFDHQTR